MFFWTSHYFLGYFVEELVSYLNFLHYVISIIIYSWL